MSATIINGVAAWEALDSRGNPTVGCVVTLSGGAEGQAIVPSGASTGTFEARELRDGGARYAGKGCTLAVGNVRAILAPAVVGVDAADQAAVDSVLCGVDPSPQLESIGANAVLAVSIATAVAVADARRAPLYEVIGSGLQPLLPMPMVNVLSGGAHAAGATDVQDFLVIPLGASSFGEAIEWCWRARRGTARVAAEAGLPVALVADEGGLGLPLTSNRAALELLARGVEGAGLELGPDIGIAIDVAATQLRSGDTYALPSEGREIDAGELVGELVSWCDAFPIVSIEDPVADDDEDGWRMASQSLGGRVQLVGDDLFVTDSARLSWGIAAGIANAVLVKPNQTGTLTRAADVVVQARRAGYATVVSARSGETEEAWLADLAVGWRAGQIKVGSTTRSERTAKWNRLIRLEQTGRVAEFAGRSALRAGVRDGHEQESTSC